MTKLGGYLVAFEEQPSGRWWFTATDPDGRLVDVAEVREASTRGKCERLALRAIERHARREEIDGETLRERVRRTGKEA